MKKLIKIIIYSFLFIVFAIVSLLFLIFYAFGGENYSYIKSVSLLGERYSLYDDLGWDGNKWVIYKHDINYKGYKKVEKAKEGLYVFNNNPEDIYLFHLFSIRFSSLSRNSIASVDITKNKYLTFSLDGKYYFLYDIEQDKKYYYGEPEDFINLNEQEVHEKILDIITNIY